jgi:peroxiredoxin
MPALETPTVELGQAAPDFRLKATDGKIYTLSEARGPKGLLVMFICNHCPFVQAVADKLTRDTTELAPLGINSIAIMSNDTVDYPADSFDNMKLFKAKHNFPFPYVIDETQEVARAYGALCTPDFFGYDADLNLRFRGRLDASGMKRDHNAKRELFEAMKQIAETGKAPADQKPSIGCSIKWRA